MDRLPRGQSDGVEKELGEDKPQRLEVLVGAKDDQFGKSEDLESASFLEDHLTKSRLGIRLRWWFEELAPSKL